MRIVDDIELLKDFGSEEILGDIEKIKGIKKKIWELKTKCERKIIYRTLFECVNSVIYILNIFNKKTQKTPKKEIDKASKRSKQ